MAEARSKLATSSSQSATKNGLGVHELLDDNDNGDGAAAPAAFSVGKKRHLPPPSGSNGGGGGGILRKSKYSSAPPPPKAKNAVGNDLSGSNNNALGSLMADYDDSSSDDGGGEADEKLKVHTPGVNVAKAQQRSSHDAPTARPLGEPESAPVSNKRQKKRTSPSAETAISGDGELSQSSDVMEGKNHESPRENQSEVSAKGGEDNTKSSEIADAVWDEFNSLLEEDEAKANDVAANEAIAPEAAAVNAMPSEDATKKSKKKKKRRKAAPRDVYDNAEMNDVEQASYEARLARLMLLKRKKNRHDGDTAAASDIALPSAGEFYDGGLAFRREDDEPAEEGGVVGANLKQSSASEAEETSPNISLAKILRDRRDQARQLSARGGNAVDNGSSQEDNDNAPDGQWF